METLGEDIQQLILDKLFGEPFEPLKPAAESENDVHSALGHSSVSGLDFEAAAGTGFLAALLGDCAGDNTDGSAAKRMRKRESSSLCCATPLRKRSRPESLGAFDDLGTPFLPDCDLDLPDFSFEDFTGPSAYDGGSGASAASDTLSQEPYLRAGSVESSEDSCAQFDRPDSPCAGRSAEYHLEQIQRHAQLAIAALRRGDYEHDKNIVIRAHDLKNKVAHEVKKAAEQAWEADKNKQKAATTTAAPRRTVLGSTKRVEQFRKNMRRWMIGTQVGVEWMVYARMEHLEAIAKYILGPALPTDPAGPAAVAESLSRHLHTALPQAFVDSELAEPEPGKRYAVGPRLAPLLQAAAPRRVPTLAFAMPPEADSAALEAWRGGLRALFPKKPAPKIKMPAAA